MPQTDEQPRSPATTADGTTVVAPAPAPASAQRRLGVAEALADVRAATAALTAFVRDGKKRKDPTVLAHLDRQLRYAHERLEQVVLAEQCALGIGAGAAEDSQWRFELWFLHGDIAFPDLSTRGVAQAAWDAARAALAEQQAEALQAAA